MHPFRFRFRANKQNAHRCCYVFTRRLKP
jgi:hypothetical protein